jgi:hypothetical protein
MHNMAKIKVVLVGLRLRKADSADRPIKASVARRRFSNRRRNTAEGFHPQGEGVRRRRTVDSLSRLPNNNKRPSVALRRSIRTRRIASCVRSCSRTKIIRREISGRCSVVA